MYSVTLIMQTHLKLSLDQLITVLAEDGVGILPVLLMHWKGFQLVMAGLNNPLRNGSHLLLLFARPLRRSPTEHKCQTLSSFFAAYCMRFLLNSLSLQYIV